jgi:hypothetical protein
MHNNKNTVPVADDTKPITMDMPVSLDQWIKDYAKRTGRKYRGVVILAVEAYRSVADRSS